jgi:LuxR family maltose regulon positive regulatory protein
MNDGEIETVWAWLDALPEERVEKSAPLSVATCWILWLTGQIGAIEPHLVNAERALGGLVVPQGIDKDSPLVTLPAELAALRSFVTRYRGDFESAGALAEHALSLVSEDLPPLTDVQLHGLIYLALASAYDGAGHLERAVSAYIEAIRWSRLAGSAIGVAITYRLAGILRLLGRLRAADAVCREALAYVKAQGMDRLPAAGILHVALSEVLVEQNELEAAEAHLAEGFELGKWSGRLDAVRNAAYTLTRLRHARDDLEGALRAIEEAEAALGEPPSPLAQAELLALKARTRIRQGAVGEAARCAEEAVELAGGDRGQTGEMAALAASRVRLAQSKPGEAVAALTRALAAAEERGLLGVALELHLLRGLAHLRGGDPDAAEADLEAALALAEPEGYVRIFLDEGPAIQRLLAQWSARAAPGPLRDHALRLLAHFERETERAAPAAEKPPPAGDLIEPLTERELEVLHLVALGMTNREIAQQLVVAPGTVKAHTSSIYRKLDVANRTEAAARARQLGILS